jgi:hypothetical protein
MPAPTQAFVEIGEAFDHEWILLAIVHLTFGISENTCNLNLFSSKDKYFISYIIN